MIRNPLRGPGTALVLGLLVGCTSGCLTEPTEEGPLAPAAEANGNPQILTGIPSALFILQATDLLTSAWPAAYAGYSTFVCNPSLKAYEVQKIHNDIPGALALAYVNLQDLQYESNLDNPYWAAFASVFDSSLCVRDRPTGRVIRVHGYNGVPGSGLMHAIPHQRNVEILVAFHRDVTMAAGFDGLYLDESYSVYPPWRRSAVSAQSANFDVDADGLADTVDKLVTKWSNGRAAMTSRLRQVFGNSVYLVANAGGPLVDSNLNGITLEGVGVRFTFAQAKSYLLAQKAVGRAPFVGAGWVTSAASALPTYTLALQVPGTHFGRVPLTY